MNYHIEQLEGLIEKKPEHRYVLTSLGKKAANQLKQLNMELTAEDEIHKISTENPENKY